MNRVKKEKGQLKKVRRSESKHVSPSQKHGRSYSKIEGFVNTLQPS